MANRDRDEVFPYVVVLKKKHQRTVDLISIFTLILFFLLLTYTVIGKPDHSLYFGIPVIISFAGLLAYNIKRYWEKKPVEFFVLYLMAIFSPFFFPAQSAFFIAMAITGFLSRRKEEIGFSEKHIVFKTIFSKKIQWEALNNAMIKDGILTLDYKNNKLFQAETDDDEENEDYDVSEEEFNSWCKNQLTN
jgi:hypothetical protein